MGLFEPPKKPVKETISSEKGLKFTRLKLTKFLNSSDVEFLPLSSQNLFFTTVIESIISILLYYK